MMKRRDFLTGTCSFAILLFASGCNNWFSDRNWFFGKKKTNLSLEPFVTETEDGKPRLVGDVAAIGNTQTIPVHGFGFVTNLPGTGGEDANSLPYRQVLEAMQRNRVTNARYYLSRPDTAVVEIRGFMPAGIQQGDRFDVEVFLPRDTETRSLRNGILLETTLAEMNAFGNVGTPRARVAGPIMVRDPMATEATNPEDLKWGTILSGAVTNPGQSRNLSIIMREPNFHAVGMISRAINDRFHLPTGTRQGVASAETDEVIILQVHPTYANDVSRYIRIIQSIAVFETSTQRDRRIERLGSELLHPETSQHAAFQLEAIGRRGIPALQQGLRSPSMEVRFHAATSLAYLGDGTAARELAEIAKKEPAFRVFALNALSVMTNDWEAEMHLQELLHVPCTETRYGAFRALNTRNPLDRTIRGERLGAENGFWYHGIATQAPPMVHITTRTRPEVVLFGADISLIQPFTLEAGTMIFVNGQITPGSVTVTRFAINAMDERRTVSNRLDEVIRAVVDMEGTYPDVVQMLRQAHERGVLSARLEIDNLPEADREFRRPMVWEEEEPTRTFWERMNPLNLFAPNPGEDSSDFVGTRNRSSRN